MGTALDIKATVARMTLEEKAGLLSGLDFWHTKPVERLGVPSCMLSDGPHGLRKQDVSAERAGINDSIQAVCFPTGSAAAASFDRNLLYALGDALGVACQHEGVSVVLGPAVNIKRSPLCGRNFEYYSEDPYLAGEAAVSMIRGVQRHHVGTSIKHFALNSQEHRRMSSDSVCDERALREIYLPAFEAAVKRAKPWTVMCSYNLVNGEYASQNHWLLTELLRGEWGFDGYVMSDWGAVSDRVAGVAAGLDLEMPSSGGENDRRVVQAVREGRLSEALVDLCCERILTINESFLTNARPDTVWDKQAQHEQARRMAADCMVLLKNEGGILPLAKDAKVAVIGPFAKQPRFQGGGSSHIRTTQVTSAWDVLGSWPNVTYAEGYAGDGIAPDERLLAEAEAAARKADVAVVFAGLPDSFESEGYDRTHMHMPACQEALIERVGRANPNTVVVLHNGSPIEMPWLGSARAVVEAYLGGQAVGGAAVDVLFGDVNPSGRLPESFPLRLEDNPSYPWYGGEMNVAEYREGVFVGYRWYDKRNMSVLFPFGHGLSYTTFAYQNLRLDRQTMADTDTLTVRVDVQNTGSRAGKEVVQLYVADRESTAIRPVRELKGFEKVWLEAGETKTVTFTLDKRAFATWNVQLHDWHVESGVFGIQIGVSSRDIVLEADVTVRSTVTVPRPVTLNTILMDLLAEPKFTEELKPLIDMMHKAFASHTATGAAAAAISDEMLNAIIAYLPLRSSLSFANGTLTYDDLLALVERLNQLR